MGKTRNSNIELLRIVAMLMIITGHITAHVSRYQLCEAESIARMANGLFSYPDFYRKLFLIEGVLPFGVIANDIFILISGYFMVEKGTGINLEKISKKLLYQVGFAALALLGISTVYYSLVVPAENSIIYMGSIAAFNNMNWFVGYYFVVIVCAALFLNKFLMKIERSTYRTMLIVVFFIMSFGWTGRVIDDLASGLRNIVCGLFLYALGGYIKKYKPFEKVRTWCLPALIVVMFLLLYVSYYNLVHNNMSAYFVNSALQEANGAPVPAFQQPVFGLSIFDLIPVVFAVVMLELFTRIRIPNSRVINFMGASTLMMYLLHDNDFFKSVLRQYDWIEMIWRDPFVYILELLKWTAITFATGVVMYAIYLGSCRLFSACKKLVLKSGNS